LGVSVRLTNQLTKKIKNMYNHHNPKLAQPIMNNLIQTLGSHWSDSSYANDLVASISRSIPNPDYPDYMTVLLPNSTQSNIDAEQVSNYAVKCGDESEFVTCETLEETIEMVKELEDAIANKFWQADW